ncbi:MAG: zinc ABC transporter permease subunit ZnuB [Pontibacterium sp.]
MIDFIIRALLGGIGVAAIAGPLGSFVVWRRMAYFGDTLAHSALLGVSLGFLLDINLTIAVVFCCIMLAVILVSLQRQQIIATDTLLGIMAHSSLSLGIVSIALFDDVRIDLMSYLFGDLLAVSSSDLYWVYGAAIGVGVALYFLWDWLIITTINQDMAQVEGVPVTLTRLALMLLIAVIIAVAMKIVGILLITSLLIIPAAASRRLASTPEQMALGATVLGCIAVVLGIGASYQFDTPAGPSVVLIAALEFLILYSLPKRA